MKNERKRSKIQLLAVTVLVMLVLVCGGIYISATAYTERAATVSSDGDTVWIRTGPGTSYDKIDALADKTHVTIIDEAVASDGSKWFKIRYTANDTTIIGYMHSAYLIYDDYSGLDDVEKKSFEELLAEFPASYKTQLLILHDMYPNWKFVAMNTGLEWSDVLAAESSNGRSLVSTGAISSWKSTEGDAYDWNTSTWKGRDGSKWVTASKEIVAYYLDPRNYLDGSMVFAFITHEYDEAEQTVDGVRSVIGSSFMSQPFTESDGTTYDYAEVLMNAGKTYGVSPYVLAAMIRIEIGYNGDSTSISGVVPGLEGLYNYYNGGAYKDGNWETANQRGLWYAGGEGEGKTTYGRPWNTRYAALMGGADFYASSYVARGQNTLYLKRFNVTSTDTYGHQYMTNIQGAAAEANVYSLAYNAEAKQQNLVFYIPVYNNMPETACVKPTRTGSPNNKLDSITIDGTVLADFNMDTSGYRVEVGADVDKIVLGAAAKDGTAAISGTGEAALAVGDNNFTINCTAQNGDVRSYAVTVVRPVSTNSLLKSLSVSAGALTPAFSSDVYDYRVMLSADQAELNVSAEAQSKQAKVEVTGAGQISSSITVITVKVTAGDGTTVSEYRITAERPAVNESVTVTSGVYNIDENKYITGLAEQPVTAETLLANLAVTGGTAQVTAADGATAVTNVGTGTLVKIYDETGALCNVYTVVIYGDVSGDGVIDDLDFLKILKVVMGYSKLECAYGEAGDLNHNGKIDDIDFLRMLKHVMGYENSTIVQ